MIVGKLLNNRTIMQKRKDSLYKRFLVWRLRNVSERTFMLVLSVFVGLLSGLAAVVLKTAVHQTNAILLRFGIPTFVGGNLLILLYPAIGILLTVLFVNYIVRRNIGHGLPTVLFAISRKGGRLPARNTYTSLVASTLTVAFGGSVGLEAPIASTGSAIGSNVAQLFRLSQQSVKMLLGCGAAGAIAGIFQAPIAGVFFVVEVFMFDLTKSSAIPLLLSAISSSALAYFLMGSDMQFAFRVVEGFELSQIPFYVVLGIFCAACSIYFLRTTDRVEGWFAKRKNNTGRLVWGAVLLGVMIFLFPPLFGEGYAFLSDLLKGDATSLFDHSIFGQWENEEWAVLAMLLSLLLLKAVATAVTIGSGGVGGTFGPALILGGLAGYFVATLSNQLGLPLQSVANFALVGMAAVMTGVMQAPMMAVFLIAEITGGYALMAPLLIASAVTFLCVTPFERHSIYARKLAAHGDLLTHDKDQSAWQLMDMRKLIETNFVCVHEGDTLGDLVEAIKESHRNVFPVLKEDGLFVGTIQLDDVRKIIFRPEYYDLYNVDEFTKPVRQSEVVCIEDPPQDVVAKFQVSNLYNLVVVDEEGHYVGMLSRSTLFSAYRRFVSAISEE